MTNLSFQTNLTANGYNDVQSGGTSNDMVCYETFQILFVRNQGIGIIKADLIQNLETIATLVFVEKMQTCVHLNLSGPLGPNVLGAKRIFAQGAKLRDLALLSSKTYDGCRFKDIKECFVEDTLPLIKFLSVAGVHSQLDQLQLLLIGASEPGAEQSVEHQGNQSTFLFEYATCSTNRFPPTKFHQDFSIRVPILTSHQLLDCSTTSTKYQFVADPCEFGSVHCLHPPTFSSM